MPVRGPKLSFSIYKTPKSTLPPILNAMEVYIVKDFLKAPTDQEDGMPNLLSTHWDMQLYYYFTTFVVLLSLFGWDATSIQFENNVGVY